MPRGVKNVQKVEEDTTAEVKTVETEVSANNETKVDEVKAAAVEDVKKEEVVASAAEVKKDIAAKKEDAAQPADHEVKMMTGTFKVYRGRNIATITSLTSAVIPTGEVIEEDGNKWLPVSFTSRTGKQAVGYIITQ